jgi:hypothetical protein
MLIFSILTCACAAYFAGTFEFFARSTPDGIKSTLMATLETVGRIAPIIICGAVQYWRLTQTGATGSRLWLPVAGTAIGAPIAGAILMLIVVFAIFGKTP